MTEETLFALALEKHTPAERSAFLEEACDGDAALRQRAEALLSTHDKVGDFLQPPAVEQLAADPPPGGRHDPAATQAESLAFFEPADQRGALPPLGHYTLPRLL